MSWTTEKFDKEIQALRRLQHEQLLHPLRKEQLKHSILARVATAGQTASQPGRGFGFGEKIWRYAAAALLGLSLIGGTALASNNSRPGDLLFPVKKAKEQLQINLAPDIQSQAQLQTKFAQERLDELTSLKAEAQHAQEPSEPKPKPSQAQVQAETEVSHAITSLREVKTKLEDKGNLDAAAAVNQTIFKLEDNLRTDINTEPEDGKSGRENDRGQKNNIDQHSGDSSSTLPEVKGAVDINPFNHGNGRQDRQDTSQPGQDNNPILDNNGEHNPPDSGGGN